MSKIDKLKDALSNGSMKKSVECRTCETLPPDALELIAWWVDERAAGRMKAPLSSVSGNSKSLHATLQAEYGYTYSESALGRHVGNCLGAKTRKG